MKMLKNEAYRWFQENAITDIGKGAHLRHYPLNLLDKVLIHLKEETMKDYL
jgi:hypothetical protein